MSTHKHIDRICLVAVILSLLLSILFVNGEALGIQTASRTAAYETRLFDTSRVHTIDIVMDDWDAFLQTCRNEEYSVCSVVIDGEAFKNVGIRGKGNTSLSNVASMNSNRYSFKIEFDQYDNTKTYHGLDKLSLNNLIQDNTMMKDYLTYQLMGQLGAPAPLCSYVYLTVNGEDWGLYLAVEAIEDSFLQRNYGSDYGELYKPDSMNFGGGRGNGKDFNMDDFMAQNRDNTQPQTTDRNNMTPSAIFGGEMPEGFDPSAMFGGGMPEGFDPTAMFGGGMPEGFDPTAMFGGGMPGTMPQTERDPSTSAENGKVQTPAADRGNMMGGFGGMGGGQTKLQYIDDDPSSYSTIFESAKTDITNKDKTRLIQSLKALSAGEDIPSVVAVDDVIRYFVVHNFVCNGDSYTGSMIHNYYLYEEDGQLSMLPWDYNLAFGTFQSSNATSTVNTPIDTPVSGTTGEDRPMIAWIFADEEYTRLYHRYFQQFLDEVDFAALIDETAAMITPYVEKDPTKFCTVDSFQTGVATIREFCLLREQSVLGQLDGTIPATTQGQNADSSALIDASHITISQMGSMGRGMSGGMDRNQTSTSKRDIIKTSPTNSADFPTLNRHPSAEQPSTEQPAGTSPSTRPPTGGNWGGGMFPGQTETSGQPTQRTPGNTGRPGQSSFAPGGSFGGQFATAASGSTQQPLILLGVSSLILCLGLLIAFKFKR